MPVGFIPRKRYPMANLGVLAKLPKDMTGVLRTLFMKHAQDEQLNYDAIERRISGAVELIYSSTTAITTAVSNPQRAKYGGTLGDVLCLLGTAGSTSTTVTIYKDGASVGTCVIASSAVLGTATLNTAIASTDIITVAATTIGTGAAKLTVYLATGPR